MSPHWSTPTRLAEVGRAHPDFAAAVAVSDGAARWTYAELDRLIETQHAALRAQNLPVGARVVLLLPPSIGFIAGYFACHRAGLVVMPLNPLLGIDEVRFILATMRPALVIAATPDGAGSAGFPILSALDDLSHAAEPAMPLWRIDAATALLATTLPATTLPATAQPAYPADAPPAPPPAVIRDPDDEALILFTSGTSGRPKGASHREGALIANAAFSNAVLGIAPADVILCPLPLSHVFGQIVLMLGSLMAGAELVLVPRPGPATVLAEMIRRRVTVLAAVPTTLAALAQAGRHSPGTAQAASAALRFVMAGGAPLPAATAQAFEAAMGVPVHQGYGMTEVACCIAIEAPGRQPTGGVGQVCATLRHRVMPLDTAPAASHAIEGELEIAGPNLMRGYYVDGTFRPREADTWFPTGDIVRIADDGTLFLCDRRKEMIIRNGYNVYPSEVETALAAHPAVLHAAVIGVPDDRVGQDVAAFVSLKDGACASAEELADWCRSRIALYKYPRRIAILPQLPLNATGKIVKRELDTTLLQRVELL